MTDPCENLFSRVSKFGNHHQKFLFTIRKYRGELSDRLDAEGLADQVHFWSTAPNPKKEMGIIRSLTNDPKQELHFLGCYFSLQYLRKLLHLTDILSYQADTSYNLTRTYRDFMEQVRTDFQKLIAAYMEHLVDHFFGDSHRPEFVVCSVGTREDQDDIDVGIIAKDSSHGEELNHVIGNIITQMMKHAIPLHCHLSEHVGQHGFSTTVDEYVKLLRKEIQDFVIITEMLSATPILGSHRIFNEFRSRVTLLYYRSRRDESTMHEAYLRGILGEVRNHLYRSIRKDIVNPKDDAIRMIKNTFFAFKTIYDIQNASNVWEILDELNNRDPKHRIIFYQLEESLSFFEVFRFLYQLYIVQEETIRLDEEISKGQINLVAETMGYREIGIIQPWDHLIVHYYGHLKRTKDNIKILLTEATKYLKGMSTFYSLIQNQNDQPSDKKQTYYNFALDFFRRTKFFRGTTFWDDFLESLEADDLRLLKIFIKDFDCFKPKVRQVLIKNYAKFSEYTYYAIIELQNILWRNRHKVDSEQLFIEFSDAFIADLEDRYDVVQSMARIFTLFPLKINEYLAALAEDKVRRFIKLFERKVWNEEIALNRNRILALCKIYNSSSKYFKRLFQMAIVHNPEIIWDIDRPTKLSRIADGIYGTLELTQDIKKTKDALADYYDIEFLRISLEALNSKPFDEINENYTKFIDNYLQALFNVCKSEIDQRYESPINTRDSIAIMASGGLAREQAYDDDWDLIVLVNSDDPTIIEYVEKIMAKMHHEIVRRGAMPHYRMSDIFEKYVTPISALKKYLENKTDAQFIEKSQLLAPRMLVGSKKFLQLYNTEIIYNFIFQYKYEYINRMIQEIRARQADYYNDPGEFPNIKECPGGLRDIELTMLIFKAKYELNGPLNGQLIDKVIELVPAHGRVVNVLKMTFAFLKHLRDIYRLTVALEDVLDEKYLTRVANILGYRDKANKTAVEMLMNKYHQRTRRAKKLIDNLLIEVEKEIAEL